MITPLYPYFEKRIKDAFDELAKQQVEPWAMFNSGKPIRLKNFLGGEIYYEGIGFEGSPENVFWSMYIEPFMEKIVVTEINEAFVKASERRVNADLLLKEVESLLLSKVKITFMRMAEIDCRLKGRGFPENVPMRSTAHEYDRMKNFIELRIRAEQELWRRAKLDYWLKNNTFLVWAIGIVIAVIGLYKVLK